MAKRKAAFHYADSWQCLTEKDADAVREFWTREKANVEGDAADRRVHQVVSRVLDANGDLAAISTAVPRVIPRLMQPMYYYRCFVGAAWRDKKLPRPLLRHTFDQLDAWARERDFPCIGMLLELENESFARTLQRAYWFDTEFSFIGRNKRGLDLRVRYFRGARLKTQQEMAALVQQGQSNPPRTGTG